MSQRGRKRFISKCSQIRPLKKYDVKIPKIFFQTCWSYSIPKKWASSPESIKELMPDWHYLFMDDEENRNFVKKHFPDFLSTYDSFPYGIQRADAVRYIVLYVYGGIYMDLDFELLHPLDSLFTGDVDVYLVKSGNVGAYYTNSFMASKPRAKFWLEVIEEMKKPLPFYIVGKHFQVMNASGPLLVSRVAARTSTVIGCLPAKYIMPCNICNLKCSTCESYLRPLEGSSWVGIDTKFLNFWLCNWKTVVAFLLCLVFLLLLAWLIRVTGVSNDSLDPRNLFNFS